MGSKGTFGRGRGHASRLALTLAAALACLGLFAAAGAQAKNFSITNFSAAALNQDGTPSTEAGGRPFELTNSFAFDTATDGEGRLGPVANAKDVSFSLPPGNLANVARFPQCKQVDFPECPDATQVGVVQADLVYAFGRAVLWYRVFNMEPPGGIPAQLAFEVVASRVKVNFHLRSESDYGATATLHNINMAAPVFGSTVSVWGVPADPAHDYQRGSEEGQACAIPSYDCEHPYPSSELRPFLSNPTSCTTPQAFSLGVTSWQFPEEGVFAPPVEAPSMSGCDALEFDPSIDAKPTTNLADSPSGLEFHLHIPQPEGVTPTEKLMPAVNEEQSLKVFATEGQLYLGFGGEVTADLPFNASAGAVQSALEGLASIGAGNVAVSGGPGDETGSTPYKIAFQGALAGKDIEQIGVASGATPLKITNGSGTVDGSASTTTTTPGAPAIVKKGVKAQPVAAHLRESKVVLPPSLVVNPSSANGLGACSPAQIGMTTPVGQADAHFTDTPAECPDDSKLGTVRIDSPAAVNHPLEGTVYLASQNQNPFASLLAMYITVNDPETGIVLKLPAKIEVNQQTGQLTTTVSEAPQLPFEDLTLQFLKGSVSPLKTGIACGSSTVNTDMLPWSAPEGATMHPSDSFEITRGAGGGPCASSEAAAPNKPGFEGGTLEPTAGAYSAFSLKLTRQDGEQQLAGIDTTLPKGLIAKLAGVPYCSDQDLAAAASKSGKAEQASASCPSASKVGVVGVAAGAGPTPFNAGGSAYLAGPYKGAPLSLAVVTPAVAGPFDLGTVVVRNALYVNPETAQVRAVSDPFPSILQGIPLDLRSIAVSLDRNQFTKNPTNCNPFEVTGSAAMLSGQRAPVANRFQVGECRKLKFKPKLALSLKGGTKRSDYPALKAVLTAKDGESGISFASVTLPRSEFLENSHIKTICTRVQFAADACPPGSVYGKARGFTPLLDKPLEGPVYLRSSSHKLPDLVAALDGQIGIDLVGRIDSVDSRLRTTFEEVPDAPVSKFVLEMQGGKKGLLVNNRNLCKSVNRAGVIFDGQSGKSTDSTPVVTNSCRNPARHR